MAIRFAGNYHIIQNNDIYNVCYETSDVGVIYTLRDWTFHGNQVCNNLIHDIIISLEFGLAAVYLDDMVSGIQVERNQTIDCWEDILTVDAEGKVHVRESSPSIQTSLPKLLQAK